MLPGCKQQLYAAVLQWEAVPPILARKSQKVGRT